MARIGSFIARLRTIIGGDAAVAGRDPFAAAFADLARELTPAPGPRPRPPVEPLPPAARIRRAIERSTQALLLRPSLGRGTAVTRVRLVDGLVCDVEDGPWRLRADMTEKVGGTNSAPNPGVLVRAALGTCLAIGYAEWAARLGVALEALSVDVYADYDVGGELGTAAVRPGYLRIRTVVSVASPAPSAAVMQVLDHADRHGSMLDLLANGTVVERTVRIGTQQESAAA